MTKNEFSNIVSAVKALYPKQEFCPDKASFDVWFAMLNDLNYQIATLTLQKWASTNKWTPTVAEFRELYAELTSPKIDSWSESFEKARAAIRRYGSYQKAEALASLDELTRLAVERMGYTEMCMCELDKISIERANYKQIYEGIVAQRKNQSVLSAGVQEQIARITNSLGLIESKGEN